MKFVWTHNWLNHTCFLKETSRSAIIFENWPIFRLNPTILVANLASSLCIKNLAHGVKFRNHKMKSILGCLSFSLIHLVIQSCSQVSPSSHNIPEFHTLAYVNHTKNWVITYTIYQPLDIGFDHGYSWITTK